MAGVQVIKHPYPTFYVQTAIYTSVVDAIPSGLLSTEDRIMRYIAETYGEKNVELMEIIHVSEEERLLGTLRTGELSPKEAWFVSGDIGMHSTA